MSDRTVPVCEHCRSEDVAVDAAARWSIEGQCWEVSTVYDQPTWCDNCNKEVHIEWEKVK